jgi:hypothetical protein
MTEAARVTTAEIRNYLSVIGYDVRNDLVQL